MTAQQKLSAGIVGQRHSFTRMGTAGTIADDFDAAITALAGINDLITSAGDLHLVGPDELLAILSLVQDRFDDLVARLREEGFVPLSRQGEATS
jgi:hypothetical protein